MLQIGDTCGLLCASGFVPPCGENKNSSDSGRSGFPVDAFEGAIEFVNSVAAQGYRFYLIHYKGI
jgi:hypothetical protein